ncbi:Alpha/Beta hydrolase protein [Lasiosphaeria hispida]|uniref:Alpha/Beta hydrolase protein n=1 Tax=Lasiosphaeria hispida TaxID=260671 RepID=A0AAJ0HSH2_9PEZI|nr:Alpha/Beta hydrolase protein [Lasiosphaeria hispida]
MSLAGFGSLPAGILGSPSPFTLHVPNQDLRHLHTLIPKANIAIPSWYNTHAYAPNGTFGVSRDWLKDAQETWAEEFDWRKHEKHYNSFPNFKINVTTPSDGQLFELHFAALFSKNDTAIPVTFLHGWPGSWLEFVPMLGLLAEKYTPETLPYHIIVPSIPDYGLSSRPREDRELTMEVAAEAMNELMVALGFDAYVAQGGDVGSFLAQVMCGVHDECKAFHLNMYFLTPEQSLAVANISVTAEEAAQLKVAAAWGSTGSAYAFEHGTRPSTIALVLSTSPVAMLTWMGEKFVEWSDNRDPLTLDTILSLVSFYWLTNSFGRAMWSYRSLTSIIGGPLPTMPTSLIKPFGYSAFPVEIATLPESWAEYLFPNLVFYKRHELGGHFAALQEPDAFLKDMEKFLAIVKPYVIPS